MRPEIDLRLVAALADEPGWGKRDKVRLDGGIVLPGAPAGAPWWYTGFTTRLARSTPSIHLEGIGRLELMASSRNKELVIRLHLYGANLSWDEGSRHLEAAYSRAATHYNDALALAFNAGVRTPFSRLPTAVEWVAEKGEVETAFGLPNGDNTTAVHEVLRSLVLENLLCHLGSEKAAQAKLPEVLRAASAPRGGKKLARSLARLLTPCTRGHGSAQAGAPDLAEPSTRSPSRHAVTDVPWTLSEPRPDSSYGRDESDGDKWTSIFACVAALAACAISHHLRSLLKRGPTSRLPSPRGKPASLPSPGVRPRPGTGASTGSSTGAGAAARPQRPQRPAPPAERATSAPAMAADRVRAAMQRAGGGRAASASAMPADEVQAALEREGVERTPSASAVPSRPRVQVARRRAPSASGVEIDLGRAAAVVGAASAPRRRRGSRGQESAGAEEPTVAAREVRNGGGAEPAAALSTSLAAAAAATCEARCSMEVDGAGAEDGSVSMLCLICMDAPRQHGFLHGDSVHVGVCGGCLQTMAARSKQLTCPAGCQQRLPLLHTSRVWRDKIPVRTFFAIEDSALADTLNRDPEARALNEAYGYWPDDLTYTNNPGGLRHALSPLLAHAHYGDSYRWMLYGDDDTLFFLQGAQRLLRNFDADQPLAITDNTWYMDERASPVAPRCLPCNFNVSLLDGAAEGSSFVPRPACPFCLIDFACGRYAEGSRCNQSHTEALERAFGARMLSQAHDSQAQHDLRSAAEGAAARLGAAFLDWARGACHPGGVKCADPSPPFPICAKHNPRAHNEDNKGREVDCAAVHHGGAGMVLSVGLMRLLARYGNESTRIVLRMGKTTGGDALFSSLLFKHRIGFTDPGGRFAQSAPHGRYVYFSEGAPWGWRGVLGQGPEDLLRCGSRRLAAAANATAHAEAEARARDSDRERLWSVEHWVAAHALASRLNVTAAAANMAHVWRSQARALEMVQRAREHAHSRARGGARLTLGEALHERLCARTEAEAGVAGGAGAAGGA
ncbi:hypothetical protein HYH03_011991 [Edaphochlamys debaryana]|uniref:Uncharacterized protein n=1 Tax=Edaphochlamys debaryana TaxID=47281 RepID=A0A835XTR2_9CHLO|nr:hypothetical protein HYH03_011991 [Edaphochlamys debaryana]|eukprot:KAG2489540.1 hypothetical protein HYH03_011991 [Edaphochlamys debaryana]